MNLRKWKKVELFARLTSLQNGRIQRRNGCNPVPRQTTHCICICLTENRGHILKPSCPSPPLHPPEMKTNMNNTDNNVPNQNLTGPNSTSESLMMSRSGRIIKRPARYCD